MRKIELISIPEDVYPEVGKLALLFSHVEWLIANVLMLCRVVPKEYAKIEKSVLAQEYFELLLSMNVSRKLEQLSEIGFDSSKLKAVSNFRNALSHGIIFKDEDGFVVKKVTDMKSVGINLNKDEIIKNIEILKEEGGKLLDFVEGKGYKYHAPK